MSIESSPSPPLPMSTFDRRPALPTHRKPLKPALSQSENFSPGRRSLKLNTTESLARPQPRNRTMSVSDELAEDGLADLTSSSTTTLPSNERRHSEMKLIPNRYHHLGNDRRNSTPQINFSALLPHAFRSNKHHNKHAPKDETNNITAAPHFTDMTAMKADPPSSLDVFGDRRRMTVGSNFDEQRYDPDLHHHQFRKLANTPMHGSRSSLSSSNDRLPSPSHHEDSTSSSTISSVFTMDPSSHESRSAETLTFILQMSSCISEIYREHFLEYFHTNYSGEFEREGFFIASLRYLQIKTTPSSSIIDNQSFRPVRALIRTSARNYDISLISSAANEDNILQNIFDQARLSPLRTYGCIGDPKSNEKIYAFDKTSDERQHSKVGVIYQRAEQMTDNEILSNDSMPEAMCDFLDSIANRVRLQGFTRYRGDLDIKDDLHGEYSYHTQYENHEIMFNIAPMIPSAKATGQFIERKSLVGNAFVCIVFQEPGVEFSPESIAGKVTQVYITVQPNKIDGQLYYKVDIWHRSDATSVIDPPGGIYKNDKSFRDYFLTLILNSINVAIESPMLRSRIPEQRQRLKSEDLKKLCHTFNFGPIPDFVSISSISYADADIYGDGRLSTRTGSGGSGGGSATIPAPIENLPNVNPLNTIGRTSPVTKQPRRSGISKFFGALTGRSGSISSSTPPTNDNSSANSQMPAVSDGTMTLGRTSMPPTKESVKRTPSVKSAPAPVRPPQVPPRPPAPQIPNTPTVQPPTPSVMVPLPNPYNSVNFAADKSGQSINQQNNSNSSVMDTVQRNRSNSSPEDNANMAKAVKSIIAEEDYTSCSSDSNMDESSNTDEDTHEKKSVRPQNTTTANTPLPVSTKSTL